MKSRSIHRSSLAVAAALLVAVGSEPRAEPWDEPGLQRSVDEPGLVQDLGDAPVIVAEGPPSVAKHGLRLELGAGLSSLVVDPDVEAGYGGGVYLGYEYGRFGAELTVFLARNGYSGALGEVGSALLDAFIAGNITLGPTFRVTSADSPFNVTLDFALGTYPITNAIQEIVWTFGMSGGVSLGYRISRWFGIGVKLRYHIFNLTQFGGDSLIDRATLQKLGAVDRLEIPFYLGFYL